MVGPITYTLFQFQRDPMSRNIQLSAGRTKIHRWMAHLLVMELCLACGCATTLDPPLSYESENVTFEHRCRPVEDPPENMLFPRVAEKPRPGPAEMAALSTATGFSVLTVEAAHAFGALDLVTQMPALEQAVDRQTVEAKEQLREVRDQITERILLASFQSSGINAEITCEAARAEQLADYLKEKNDNRARLLTTIAVVTGGVGAIAVGGFLLAGHAVSEGIAGIIGGVLSSTFGTSALFQGATYPFKHPRNLLREIWEGPSSPTLFPDVIWRFLNRPLEEDPNKTLRTAIIMRWRRDGRLGTAGSAVEERRTALFFGEGGDYDEDDLRARAQMLNMVVAQTVLTDQYMERFLRELLARRRTPSAP